MDFAGEIVDGVHCSSSEASKQSATPLQTRLVSGRQDRSAHSNSHRPVKYTERKNIEFCEIWFLHTTGWMHGSNMVWDLPVTCNSQFAYFIDGATKITVCVHRGRNPIYSSCSCLQHRGRHAIYSSPLQFKYTSYRMFVFVIFVEWHQLISVGTPCVNIKKVATLW